MGKGISWQDEWTLLSEDHFTDNATDEEKFDSIEIVKPGRYLITKMVDGVLIREEVVVSGSDEVANG